MSDHTAENTYENADLPIISFAKLIGAPGFESERNAEVERLRQVTHEIGFFYLTDHGVPEHLHQDLFAASKEFFAQPLEVKNEISNLDNPYYRGYGFLGDERTQGKVDWREQIDFGVHREPVTDDIENHPWRILEGPNSYPESVPQLKPLVEQWQERLTALGLELLATWAESLGQPRDFFAETFVNDYSRIKLVHYPASESEADSTQGVGAHHDSGVLTLLMNEPGSTGLQVFKDDEWKDVPVIPNHFVVNIGELLEAATDGYLVATKHRVLPSAPGVSRYSIPFFLAPSLEASFPHVELPAEFAAEAAGRGIDLSGQEIFDSVGRNVLKVKLRAHPATTEKFHKELAESLA